MDKRKRQTKSAICMMNVNARTTTLTPNMNENDDMKTNVQINAITTRRFRCSARRPQSPVMVLDSYILADFDGISIVIFFMLLSHNSNYWKAAQFDLLLLVHILKRQMQMFISCLKQFNHFPIWLKYLNET